jgi:hypothetical protein
MGAGIGSFLRLALMVSLGGLRYSDAKGKIGTDG